MSGNAQTGRGGKIALFLPSLEAGGAERNLITVVDHLARAGRQADLVLVRAEGPLLETVPPTIRVVDLRAPGKAAALPGLVRYLRRERPQALLSGMASNNCVAALAHRIAGRGPRLVLSERSTLSMEIGRGGARRILPPLMRRLYRGADAVCAVSQGVADDLARMIGYPRERIRVIYNPVLTDRLRMAMRAPLDDPWFGPGAPPVVLAAGRLHPQKDYPTLIAAFARLRAQRVCRLVILGEGPERATLEAAAVGTGWGADIRLPGIAANPMPYMARAGAFALSSRWEGLPTVLIEAMACGAPVVATDCPHGPREILEGGAHGPLLPPGDVEAMAAALSVALDRPRPVAYPLGRFEAEAVIGQYAALVDGEGP